MKEHTRVPAQSSPAPPIRLRAEGVTGGSGDPLCWRLLLAVQTSLGVPFSSPHAPLGSAIVRVSSLTLVEGT